MLVAHRDCRRFSPALLIAVAFCSVISLGLCLADEASVGADRFMCHCIYTSNKWIQLITDLVKATGGQSFAAAVSSPQDAGSHTKLLKLLTDRKCDPKAGAFADTDLEFDTQRLDMLGGSAKLDGGAKIELMEFCVPGQVLLSMLCTHKFVLAADMGPALRWVYAMQNLLSFVEHCMDSDAPFPLLVADLNAWVVRWTKQPLPQVTPQTALQALAATAFPGKIALRKEIDSPLTHCLPLKDPSCFPLGNDNLFEACHACCDPELPGDAGDPNCWVGPYTFQRCCNQVPRKASSKPPVADAGGCASQSELNRQLAASLKAEEKKALTHWRLADDHKRSLEILEVDLASNRTELARAGEALQSERIAHEKLKEDTKQVVTLKEELQKEKLSGQALKKDIAILQEELQEEKLFGQALQEEINKAVESQSAAELKLEQAVEAEAAAEKKLGQASKDAEKFRNELNRVRGEVGRLTRELRKSEETAQAHAKEDSERGRTAEASSQPEAAAEAESEAEAEVATSAEAELEAEVGRRLATALAERAREEQGHERGATVAELGAEVQRLQMALSEAQGECSSEAEGMPRTSCRRYCTRLALVILPVLMVVLLVMMCVLLRCCRRRSAPSDG
mmetsp:Transcript_2641/g.10220  ORF Transcript_2641/g.10220 Transcript_2641/m.10220 type:complete len:623 (+) Transcript_2641:214-2082(+)